ncbi:twin-arginine translocase subunit TatC [Sphingosinithalassobacter portus]|uniref:twin-arginine translocase subunit TatC n=1 Tax=Stakelama portus TaxID=2676234 RepID=UPI000D6E1E99|nr:twin-arginine translocase subunit TatC [Sphingosinithalassobacter portus]
MSDRDEIDDSQAPLLDHLLELRKRLLYCAVAVAITFGASYYFADKIFAFLVQPLLAAGQGKIIFTQIFEAFFVQVKVAFFAAMMLSFPVIANQIWQFVAPGLYRREKRALLPFLLATPLLFLGGAAMAYYITIPVALQFLLGFQGNLGGVEQEALPSVGNYLDFVMQFLFAFGLAFLLPVLLMLLERSGILTYEQIKGAWRYFVVVAFGVSAVLTPPDIWSQTLLAVPMIGLYFLSLVAIRFTHRRREKAEAAEAAADTQ